MVVLDASVVVEMLLRTSTGRKAFRRIAEEFGSAHAPHLIDVEVTFALRRLVLRGELSASEAGLAVSALSELEIERHAHLLLLRRMWDLRDAITAYDGAYVALAEVLGIPLLTLDAKLSRSHGHHARIELLS